MANANCEMLRIQRVTWKGAAFGTVLSNGSQAFIPADVVYQYGVVEGETRLASLIMNPPRHQSTARYLATWFAPPGVTEDELPETKITGGHPEQVGEYIAGRIEIADDEIQARLNELSPQPDTVDPPAVDQKPNQELPKQYRGRVGGRTDLVAKIGIEDAEIVGAIKSLGMADAKTIASFILGRSCTGEERNFVFERLKMLHKNENVVRVDITSAPGRRSAISLFSVTVEAAKRVIADGVKVVAK